MSGVSRSSVVDRNICVFVWYGRGAGDGLRSVGEEALPSSKSVCSILPIAHHSRAGVSRTWTSHPARRELRLYGVLGSSLSSGAARGCLRIRHEALVDSVGDAPLEAPQRLLAGLAFRDLLAVVGTTRCVRPGLAYADHVQGVVELAVPAQREPVAHHIAALEASSGAVPE